MADWTDIADSALDPDAPLTSDLAYAWRDNVVAISEGAPNAPKISPLAFDGSRILPRATVITDLDDVRILEFFLLTDFPNPSSLEVRFSTDNGSSWGSYQTMLNLVSGGFFGTFRAQLGRLDLRTGDFLIGATTGTLTAPSGANALQFRATGGAAAFELTPVIGSGNL